MTGWAMTQRSALGGKQPKKALSGPVYAPLQVGLATTGGSLSRTVRTGVPTADSPGTDMAPAWSAGSRAVRGEQPQQRPVFVVTS